MGRSEGVETVSTIILAGGRSQRMGRDKARLPIAGKTCVERAAWAASAVSDDIWISRRTGQDPLSGVFPAGVQVCVDEWADSGPLAGLAAGLKRAVRGWSLVIPVDAPLVRPELLVRLVRIAAGSDGGDGGTPVLAVVPKLGETVYPLLAVYHKSVLSVIEKMLFSDQRKVRDLLAEIPVRYCGREEWGDCDPEADSFRMMNWPQEYRELAGKAELIRKIGNGGVSS